MTLRRRLTSLIAVTFAGTLLLGATAVLGVRHVRADLGVALRANEQLRAVYTVGAHAAAARSALAQSPPAVETARDALAAAAAEFRAADALSPPPWLADTAGQLAAARGALGTAIGRVASNDARDPTVIDPLYARLADLSAATRAVLTRHQAAADRNHHLTLLVVAALAVAISAVVLVVARRQYRAAVGPLRALQDATRRIAAADAVADGAPHRAPVTGDAEFAALATDFNAMADRLRAFHADLESRVDARTREVHARTRQLVTAERLASVGYLAAGVAHEINNPLAVIAGFAQRSIQRLDRAADAGNSTADGELSAQLRKALSVINAEAFRGKQITDRLLSLARPGTASRAAVSLPAVAADVIASVAGMPRFAGRRVALHSPGPDATVLANEGELRQVLMNLLVNALQATSPDTGRIEVTVNQSSASSPQVTLTVADNGRGIPADALPHVFEPFFTTRRGAPDPSDSAAAGTGLGLFVAHAIVADHGGTLSAESAGPGRGATFTLCLPAVPSPAILPPSPPA